jgi:hypothetical protein
VSSNLFKQTPFTFIAITTAALGFMAYATIFKNYF